MQTTVGFIGAGAMAEALISGALNAGVLDKSSIIASEPRKARREYMSDTYGIEVFDDNLDVLDNAKIIVLAVKPQVLAEVASNLKKHLNNRLVISIVAGITLAQLNSWLGEVPLVRVVPNTPCLVGEGVSALAVNTLVAEQQLRTARKIFEAVGPTYVLHEELIDAVTGLSGSGPAYIYMIIEALSDGGVKAGLPRDLATKLAAQTALGGAKMVLETGKHPGELKDMVTSPGGTTIAALHTLEKAGIRGALIDAVITAQKRAGELASKK